MNKITTEIRYKNMSFTLTREVRDLRMYFSYDYDYAIIVNIDGEVLFELSAHCGLNVGYLEDGTAV